MIKGNMLHVPFYFCTGILPFHSAGFKYYSNIGRSRSEKKQFSASAVNFTGTIPPTGKTFYNKVVEVNSDNGPTHRRVSESFLKPHPF